MKDEKYEQLSLGTLLREVQRDNPSQVLPFPTSNILLQVFDTSTPFPAY